MSIDLEGLGQQALQFLGLGDAAQTAQTAQSDAAAFKAQLDQLIANVQGLAQGQAKNAAEALKAQPIDTLFKVDGEVIGYQSEQGSVFAKSGLTNTVKSIKEEAAEQGLTGIAASTYEADRLKEELSKFYDGAEVEAVVFMEGEAPTVGEVTDALFKGVALPDGQGEPSTVAARLGLSQIRFNAETLGLLNSQPRQ